MAKKATIKITSDTKEAESGLDKVSAKLNQFSNENKKSLGSLKRFNDSIISVTKSYGAVGVAAGAAVAGIKKANAVIKETTDLYKAQENAERSLEVAAKNNPYLNGTSVVELKAFASELQSFSTVGDETILQFMSQLAAAGRTQTEIQNIMAAALDVSASGMMSLDAAVSALNKTFSGTAGQLGNQVTALKSLTKEELQSGKAVEIVAQQFKGMAKETAEATGSSERLKNAIGDYKELWGETFEKALAPMRRYFTKLISNITEARKQQREYNKAVKEVYDSEGNIKEGAGQDSMTVILQERKKELAELRESLREVNDLMRADPEAWQFDIASQERRSALLTEIAEKQSAANKIEKEILRQREINAKKTAQIAEYQAEQERKREEEAKKAAQDEAERQGKLSDMNRRDALRADFDETIRKTREQIEARRTLGETITEEEEAQQLLNAATQAYINMYSDPAFDRSKTKTGTWAGEAEQLAQIQEFAKKAGKVAGFDEMKKEVEEVIKEANESLKSSTETLLSDRIGQEIKALEEYMQTLDKTGEAYAQLTEKKNELAVLQTAVQKQELEAQAKAAKEKVAEISDVVAEYIDRFAEITNSITSLVRENNEAETTEAMTNLSKQYTDGIISYEKYCEDKKALDKKAAQEEYKLKMWEWTASFLQATANIAQGVAKALAEGGPYAGPILAALIGASGAVQIATITANKPRPPSFATGGIVPGTSYSGDRVQANVNSGEMILNAQQQRNLWDMANTRSGGAVVNMPVTIENNAADSVSASAELSASGLTILVNKIVNSQMAAGKYNQSMDIAQSRRHGVEIQ